jgi:anti-sigma factor RsiW
MSAARPQDLACRELVELLTEFLDGSLDEHTRTQVEHHVVLCGGCAEYLRQFRATIGATRKLAEEDLPSHMKDSLLDAFRHWRQGS